MSSPNPSRLHLVLVPGFGGFDALGQLEYYAGVTPLFQASQGGNETLHYFDNFPTAAVVTRAARLRRYLARRIARGEISSADEIALVGHSTGGLDIRRLLCDLHDRRLKPILVDGGAKVAPRDILGRIRRVVFLSVPHWGTNIADWVRSHGPGRKAVIAQLRAAVAGSQVPVLDWIENSVAGSAAALTGTGLLRAVQDSLREAEEPGGRKDPERTLDAHEAASQLALYLRQMASDFRAIDDLTARPPAGEPSSPAHFPLPERQREIRTWKQAGIEARSYITLGRRPFPFGLGKPALPWELANPWTYPEISKDCRQSADTDFVYRISYRACAGGPFELPPLTGVVRGAPRIEVWDNDGIVNTASMPWPLGDNVLIAADHMDIVGHYHLVRGAPGGGRIYRAYDLLRSASGFDEKIFEQVWKEIFAFCSGSKAASAAG